MKLLRLRCFEWERGEIPALKRYPAGKRISPLSVPGFSTSHPGLAQDGPKKSMKGSPNLPSGKQTYIAIEHGHRNSGFTH